MKIFSPATLANFTVGFDFMGLCLDFGDTFEINKLKEEEIRICSNINLPLNPKENICGIVYLKMKKDFSLEGGISIKINKKIPLGSGMGGSATSAVATAYAINKLYNLNLENNNEVNNDGGPDVIIIESDDDDEEEEPDAHLRAKPKW